MAGVEEAAEGRSRRDLLKALGAAAAGAVAGGVLKTEEAEAGHGVVNASSNSVSPALHAENTSSETDAVAVQADADRNHGTGMRISASKGLDINGYHEGIVAFTVEFGCIRGTSVFGTGVSGTGPHGVVGFGKDGIVTEGVGVRGVSEAGIGVEAEALQSAGTALRVVGPAKFSTVAAGAVPAGQDSVAVAHPLVTAQSHITVTLTGDPGQASSAPGTKEVVVWVERQPGTGFVVHMSRSVRFATPFTYLIVEPV